MGTWNMGVIVTHQLPALFPYKTKLYNIFHLEQDILCSTFVRYQLQKKHVVVWRKDFLFEMRSWEDLELILFPCQQCFLCSSTWYVYTYIYVCVCVCMRLSKHHVWHNFAKLFVRLTVIASKAKCNEKICVIHYLIWVSYWIKNTKSTVTWICA